jgi:hypothetical protein
VERAEDAAFTDEERALVRRLAKAVTDRGLALPGILFGESARPMHFVGSQALAWLEPIVKGLFSWEDYTRFRVILERRGSVELLVSAIEDAEAERVREIERARREGRPGWFARRFRKRRESKTEAE